jgi:hypothetical protein
MEKTNRFQHLFFQVLVNRLPPGVSLPVEMSELLNISVDSAYRRMRCEKNLYLDEVMLLCEHFNISLDQFLKTDGNSILFTWLLDPLSKDYFLHYLKNQLNTLKRFHTYEKKNIYFLARDVPWVSYLQLPQLALFKYFVWRKSILFDDTLKSEKFSLQLTDNEFLDIAKQIVALYSNLPVTEIWNADVLTSTLHQIYFYHQSGLFKSRSDFTTLLDLYSSLIDHIEKEAELGRKFFLGESPDRDSGQFTMYVNELGLGDNTMFAMLDELKITYLNHSMIQYICTSDRIFNDHIHDFILSFLGKSTLISRVAEKDRMKFFNALRRDIEKGKLSKFY